MSRIGSMPISIPFGIEVTYSNGRMLIRGNDLERELVIHDDIDCKIIDNKLTLSVVPGKENSEPIWGTYRSNIDSIIHGLAYGFSVELEINGVGYKAESNGVYLTLCLGYSHNVKYKIPKDVQVKCTRPTYLVVTGVDKQKVCMIASDICKVRKYDPYKGKGVVLKGKFMLRKVVSKKK